MSNQWTAGTAGTGNGPTSANGRAGTASPASPAGAARRRVPQVSEILDTVQSGVCQFVDLQFTDVTGSLKSVVLPARQVAETLEYGHWFDGSSLEGAARIMETDLLLRPDIHTWGILPWMDVGGQHTARLLCDIETPDGLPFPADPRAVLKRACQDAAELGYHYQVAAELEFYLFRPAREGYLNIAQLVAQGPSDQGGYFDLAPARDLNVRDAMVQALAAIGIEVEASHHEIGPGQHEIDLPLLPAVDAADAIATAKYIVKSVARQRGLLATFMPKPLVHAAGSGLHLAQVLQAADGRYVFANALDEYGLSPVARAFIAGQLAHARAMCAVLAPNVNSYKRLGRGFDAPASLSWSRNNPLAVVRVPHLPARWRKQRGAAASTVPRGQSAPPRPPGQPGQLDSDMDGGEFMRLELRCPDPSCNPYLALAVALASGLDGIHTNAEPPAPSDTGGGLRDESQIETLPVSLGEAIQELEWNPVIRDALGAPVYERLLLAKEQEWQEYRRQVSAWELERYFESS